MINPITAKSSQQRLLVCGASARAAAWSAKRAGFDVVALDLFADADLCEMAWVYPIPAAEYPQGLAKLVGQVLARQPIDGWLYTGGLENHPTVIEQIRASIPLYGNGQNSLAIVRDPLCLMSIFTAARIPCPATFPHTDSRGESWPVLADKRWLVKPRASAAGRGIRFAHKRPSKSGTAIHSVADNQGCVFQEFIDGPTYAAVFVTDSEHVYLLGVTRLWTRYDLQTIECDEELSQFESSFDYVGSTGPVDLTDDVVDQWIRIGQAVARRAGLVGLFGVDAVVVRHTSKQTVYPIEVNPRYTASVEIIERAFECSLIPWHLDACGTVGLREKPTHATRTPPKLRWGKRIRYAPRSLVYDRECAARLGRRPPGVTQWLLADTPAINTRIKPRAPILTTIAASDSLLTVERSLGFVAEGPKR